MADDTQALADVSMVNPFSPTEAPGVQVVILMRIYDVLMALLQSTDEELHDTLDAIHESGKLAWSLPSLNLDEPNTEALDNAVLDEPVPPSEVYRLGD